MVGSETDWLIRDFKLSITRANSPPEATFLRSWSSEFLFAEKRKSTWSVPVGERSSNSERLIEKPALGIPSFCKREIIFSPIPGIASILFVDKSPAVFSRDIFISRSSPAIVSNSWSIELIPSRDCCNSDLILIKSFTDSTWCFCSSE